MKYISLFAGIGGFDLALNRLGHECVWASEWDKYAAQIYDKNFGHQESGESLQGTERGSIQYRGDKSDTKVGRKFQQSKGIDTRDIRTVPTTDIPDHDLLVGGFPCQAFSIAGKRRGFDDTRGTLFFEIARILKDKNPKYFILENVKGLLSHNNGSTFKTIISTLTELGYDLQWQVVNSKNFGVPQNRERVFIVGHLRGQPRPEVFPIGTSNTLNSSDWRGANRNQKQTTIRTDEQNTQERGYKPNNTNTIRRTSYTDGMRIRRLTPTECERLQGFPDVEKYCIIEVCKQVNANGAE